MSPAPVAVLGLGEMGTAMACRLAEAGLSVRVWNRTRARADALAGEAITVADSPAAAVAGAGAALTMVRDGTAVRAVAEQMLPALAPDAVWIQTSTVGAAAADELAALARSADRLMLDAPVSGSTEPARKGTLVFLVSGPPAARAAAAPVIDALSSRSVVAGDGQEASRLKLVVNGFMCAATVAMADALAACDALGLERALFLESVGEGPLAMPYALAKARLMTEQHFTPGFPLELALKDVELLGAALGDGAGSLRQAVAARLGRAADAGHGRDDVAAVSSVS